MNFFPQCILENLMMTSLLADKPFILETKKIMTFMNEIINPPCNSLLATFFEACQKEASSCLRRLGRLKRTISELFKLLFLLPLLMSPKRKLQERAARRVLWDVQRDQMK